MENGGRRRRRKRKFKREIERQEDRETAKSREKLSKESYRIILLDLRE